MPFDFAFSLSVRLWIVVGIVLLMTAKPNVAASLLIILASAIFGVGSALLGKRQRTDLNPVGAQATVGTRV